MKLNQVSGVEGLTRDQNKIHSALSFHAVGER